MKDKEPRCSKLHVCYFFVIVNYSEVSENVNLYSDEVGDTHTEVVSSLPSTLGGTKSFYVEHLSVARIQRRAGPTEGKCLCHCVWVYFVNFFLLITFIRGECDIFPFICIYLSYIVHDWSGRMLVGNK